MRHPGLNSTFGFSGGSVFLVPGVFAISCQGLAWPSRPQPDCDHYTMRLQAGQACKPAAQLLRSWVAGSAGVNAAHGPADLPLAVKVPGQQHFPRSGNTTRSNKHCTWAKAMREAQPAIMRGGLCLAAAAHGCSPPRSLLPPAVVVCFTVWSHSVESTSCGPMRSLSLQALTAAVHRACSGPGPHTQRCQQGSCAEKSWWELHTLLTRVPSSKRPATVLSPCR